MVIDRERVLRTAEKHAARHRYKQAISEYEKLLDPSSNDARLWLKAGDLYTKVGSAARAVDSYARAGRIYANDGFAAKAIAVYKQVQDLIDHDAPHLTDYFLYVYPTLAGLYQELRLPAEAVGMYDVYASTLASGGRLREAATVLRVVLERGGDNPLTRLRLAELLIEEGEPDEALDEFFAAAQGLATLDRVEEALRVVDHASARMSSPRLARLAARIHLDRGGDRDGMHALVRLQQAFTAEPKNLDTLALLARAFEAIDQPDRAFEVRKETVRIAKEQGATDTARILWESLRKEAPDDPAVRALMTPPPPPVNAMDAESSIPEVSAELLSPGEASAERHAVSVELDVPIVQEAQAPAEEAGVVERTMAQARGFLDLGERSTAIHTLQMGIESSPSALALRVMLADLLADAGRCDAAVEQLLVIAQREHEEGRTGAASVSIRRALDLDPNHVRARELAATIAPGSLVREPAPVPSVVLTEAVGSLSDSPPSGDLQDDGLLHKAPLESIRGFRGTGAVSDALEEAEFFASRGLYEDALAILEEQMVRNPGDDGLAARAETIRKDMVVSEPQPSVLGVSEPTAHASRLSQGVDPEFLESALADLTTATASQGATIDLEGGTLDVDDLFHAFQEGIAAQVDDKDSEMHYDLGVAYLEMGKLGAAVDAFQKAAQDPARACVSLSMIASVHRSQGDLDAAMKALEQAAEVPRKNREEEVGVHYELGVLHEAREDTARARQHFSQVVRLAPDFRDARARLQALRGLATATADPAETDDELDRAFDGLMADLEPDEPS